MSGCPPRAQSPGPPRSTPWFQILTRHARHARASATRQAPTCTTVRAPRPCTSPSARRRAACGSSDPHALDLEYTRTMMGFLLFDPAPRDSRHDRPGRRLAGQVLPPPPEALRASRWSRSTRTSSRCATSSTCRPTTSASPWCAATARSSCATAASRCDVLLVDGFDSRRPAFAPVLRSASTTTATRCCGPTACWWSTCTSVMHASRSSCDRIRRSFDDAVLRSSTASTCANSIVFAAKGRVSRRAAASPRAAEAVLGRARPSSCAPDLRMIASALKDLHRQRAPPTAT
ncbi:MAG: hypothetical protein MZW92_34680 [Comamonadaceae bacterium]|nr:hypothetical protein [Comamonadaceae bacterium]